MSDTRLAEFISKMAHELRSPLTSVKGFSAMLVNRWDRFDDAQRFEFVSTIQADAERMGRIVSEVLDLARMEAGRLELQHTLVEVGPLLERAAARNPGEGEESRIGIESPDALTVLADAERLETVVSNLIENALKFSDDGPVTVVAAEGADTVTIRVDDQGIGIDAEALEELFMGPGRRSEAAMPSGSGLGLYLSKGLIEAHGGEITVSSTPGVGSTFTIVIPRRGLDG